MAYGWHYRNDAFDWSTNESPIDPSSESSSNGNAGPNGTSWPYDLSPYFATTPDTADAGYRTIAPLQNQPMFVAQPPRRQTPPRREGQAETRYPCLFSGCEAAFSRLTDLKRHMRSFHEQHLIDCPYNWCGRTGHYGFVRMDHLNEHILEFHKANIRKTRGRWSASNRKTTAPERDLDLGMSIHSLAKGPNFGNLANQLDKEAPGLTQDFEAPERDKRKIATTGAAEQDKLHAMQKENSHMGGDNSSTSIVGTRSETSGPSHEQARAGRSFEDTAILAGNPVVREGKLMDLEMFVNDVKLTTIPDTGAQINAIPLSTLQHIQWRIEESGGENSVIKLGNNTSAQGLFRVLLDCRIPKVYPNREKSKLTEFHVFRKLATGVDAIVGLEFLETTNVLTSYAFCLKERINPARHIPRCMSVGPILASGLRLKIFLNRKCFLAMPDTGSEINLIVRACAVKSGFKIVPLPKDEKQLVEFADGHLEPISEKVLVVVNAAGYSKTESRITTPTTLQPFSLGLRQPSAVSDTGQDSEPQVQTFYILDNLTHEVILSQQLLHSMDAWSRYPSAFETVSSQNSSREELCTIFSRRVKQLAKETSEFHCYTLVFMQFKADEIRLVVSQCNQREAVRQSEIKSQRNGILQEIERLGADSVKRRELLQALDDLDRKDNEERAKFREALATLTQDRDSSGRRSNWLRRVAHLKANQVSSFYTSLIDRFRTSAD